MESATPLIVTGFVCDISEVDGADRELTDNFGLLIKQFTSNSTL
jgi:hypothetical protein